MVGRPHSFAEDTERRSALLAEPGFVTVLRAADLAILMRVSLGRGSPRS